MDSKLKDRELFTAIAILVVSVAPAEAALATTDLPTERLENLKSRCRNSNFIQYHDCAKIAARLG